MTRERADRAGATSARLLALAGQIGFIVLTIWAFVLIKRELEGLDRNLELRWSWLAWSVSAKLGAVICLGLKFRAQCLLTGVKLDTREWLGLSSIATFHAYLSPAQTGHLFRAIYLRKRHAMSYEAYAAQTIGVNLLEVMLAGVLGGGLCLLLGGGAFGLLPAMIAAIVVPALIAMIAPASRRVGHDWAPPRLRNWLARAHDSIARVSRERHTLGQIALLSVWSIVLRWLGLYYAFRLCSFDVNVTESLLIECVRTVTMVVTITPGNLGLTEGVIAGTAGVLGVSVAAALAAAVVSRLLSMAIHVALGLWYTRSFAMAMNEGVGNGEVR